MYSGCVLGGTIHKIKLYNNHQFEFLCSFIILGKQNHSKLGLYTFQSLQSFCFILMTSNKYLDLFISPTLTHVHPSTLSSPVVSSCQIVLLTIKVTFPSLVISLEEKEKGGPGPGSQVDVDKEKYSEPTTRGEYFPKSWELFPDNHFWTHKHFPENDA